MLKSERVASTKSIALVAHDGRKAELIDWVHQHWRALVHADLVCTGTTGRLVNAALRQHLDSEGMTIPIRLRCLQSGPLGGDQQLGAMIVDGHIEALVFFWDPMCAQPHDADVKALLRIAVMYNVLLACSQRTADCVMSTLFQSVREYSQPRVLSSAG